MSGPSPAARAMTSPRGGFKLKYAGRLGKFTHLAGDHPGRNEPTTGEINYKTIFRHLDRKRYQGLIGMEHGQSRPGPEGEMAVLAAYRNVDPADVS